MKIVRKFVSYAIIAASHEWEFKSNTVVALIQGFSQVTISLVFWFAMARPHGVIQGWGFPELVALGGFATVFVALGSIFLGLRELGAAVITGDVDRYLVRPISPLVGIILENSTLSVAWNFMACGFVSIVFAAWHYGLAVSWSSIVHSVLLLGIGSISWAVICGCIGMLPFFFGSPMTGAWSFVSQFEVLHKFPVGLFSPNPYLSGVIRLLLIGYVATYPCAALLGKLGESAMLRIELIGIAGLCGWVIVLKVLSCIMLRRYESCGG